MPVEYELRPEITGMGKSQGEIFVDSAYLAKKMSEETGKNHSPAAIDRMLGKTGVISRGWLPEGKGASALVDPALNMALEMANRKFDELTVLNIATGLPDRLGVPTGAIVQNMHNGKKEIAVRDLSAACPGFIHLLQLTYADIDSDDYGNGGPQIVAAGEPASRGINPYLKATYLIFGDGGGAFVVDKIKVDKRLPKAKFSFRTDGRFVDYLSVPAGGSEKPITHESLDAHENGIHMQGGKVLELAP